MMEGRARSKEAVPEPATSKGILRYTGWMPYFWTQDAGDLKYYIRRGSADSQRTIGERIEIAKEEIHDPYGIGNEISERKRYIKKLVLAGLFQLGE